ncbi:Alpha/Beta hydrolase protein [Xylariales sp. PMI_506]|nr:Alpha/Beta hydrolase protein [Xylariales sp. PMI_506]
MRSSLLSPLGVIGLGLTVARAATTSIASSTTQTTITIPAGTVVGSVIDGVEYFRGIPYAQPPTGSKRLRPPARLYEFNEPVFQATGVGPACPQFTNFEYPPLLAEVTTNPVVAEALFLGAALGNETEDCLTVSVMRPEGVEPNDKLPVLFWIHGGGFQIGSAQPYNASVLIPRGVAQGKPFIFVAVNYRLGGFGFLGGKEILADGSANLGLLDQRMGLEWISDNIAAFGGDPEAVTIWGESAGAISVFDHFALYGGNHTYNHRPLFRAGIMDSGSIFPAQPIDGTAAQQIFDTVVEAANCTASYDKLDCLRATDYATFLTATNSVPGFLGYNAMALSYLPRPDGKILSASPDILATSGKYAAVPLIIGDVEDEGTVFSLYQANVTTTSDVVSYLHDVYFPSASHQDIVALVDIYTGEPLGSLSGTDVANETYPEFELLAATQGDWALTLTRRIFLETVKSSVPAWSFLATWGRGIPIVGTFHTSDLPYAFYGTDDTSLALQDRYISFVVSLNPNDGVATAPAGQKTYWPTWQESQQLLDFGANSTGLIKDDFRAASFEYIKSHLNVLRH